jgi:hypothetical protein
MDKLKELMALLEANPTGCISLVVNDGVIVQLTYERRKRRVFVPQAAKYSA